MFMATINSNYETKGRGHELHYTLLLFHIVFHIVDHDVPLKIIDQVRIDKLFALVEARWIQI